jgi:hypothetical protein
VIATVVDTTALWETAVYSLIAGIGVTAIFSIALLGATRMSEATRDGRNATSALYATLALIGLLGTAVAVVAGVIVMTSK